MADDLRAYLDQLLPQARKRPIFDRLGRRQRAQEVAEIVGEGMKLEPHSVGGERAAREPRPSDRSLALLDPLLARPTLVVEGDDIRGRPRHVGDDEADARVKFARMPFDLGDDATLLRPASRLIGKVRIETPDINGGAVNRASEQIADAFLQYAVGGQPNGVFDPFAFEILVDLGIGETRVGAEIDARDLALIARHDRLQHALPFIGAVNIARAQGAALQIAKLVEHEQRMIAGAFVMAVPDAQLLFAVRRADARIHVEHDASGPTAAINLVDPSAGKIGKRR